MISNVIVTMYIMYYINNNIIKFKPNVTNRWLPVLPYTLHVCNSSTRSRVCIFLLCNRLATTSKVSYTIIVVKKLPQDLAKSLLTNR